MRHALIFVSFLVLTQVNSAEKLTKKVDAQTLSKGKWYFKKHCAYCHGKEGQGELAPNLTDEYFIYGAQKELIRTIIENGLESKGMPVWKKIIKDESTLSSIIEYVISIRGQKLKGKEAQGIKVDLEKIIKNEEKKK